jgi:glutamate-1-semialdehyde 2,1-aminomutase
MSDQQVEQIKKEIWQAYLDRTKASQAHNKTAKQSMPGGDTRSIGFFQPYPFFVARGQGCRLYDVDGNAYIDFVNNMTSLVHGHAHPHVMAAIRKQTEHGITHGLPVEAQYRLAELLIGRIPSIDSLRFCNTGSEATMFCMRAARAFTGKELMVKMDGGYHGGHDFVQVNPMPDLAAEDLPTSQPTKGVPSCVAGDIRVVPFNDLAAMERVLAQEKGKTAAIIMEPMLGAGGGVGPRQGYLRGIRELADQYGVLLIFDEIISLRVHEGGLQTKEGVRPDLTAMGKIIGGGLPIGVFGGRKDIMDMFDPTREDSLTHSGTFTGNAVTMAAGLANLEIYQQDEVDRINNLGDRLAAGMNQVFESLGIKGGTRGIGSMVGIAFTDQPLYTSKDVVMSLFPSIELLQYLHIDMMNQGVFFLNRGMFTVSTPMDAAIVDQTVTVFAKSLERLKPMAEEVLGG